MNTIPTLPGNTQQTSWLSPITKDSRYLRAILTFVSKASEEQLKQVPVIGPFLLGFADAIKELSEQQDDDQSQREIEAKLGALLTQGEQAQRNSEAFAAFGSFLLEQQLQQTALLTQLAAHLRTLGLPVERKQLTEFACSASLVAYRSRVIRDYQYADQRGIQGVTRSEHVASLPLTDIYVKPRLQSERAADRSLFESRERERELLKQMLDNQDLPTGQQARLEEEFVLLTGERWRGKKEQDAVLGIGEALQRARHTVILGGPGVGKSQLTRYLALICAWGEASMSEPLGWAEELTPIVVSLAAFADARSRAQQAQPLTLRQHLDAELERRGGAALRAAIEQEMQAGRVLVLLDGVDEVPGFNERSAIVVEVENFLRDHGAVRCLVTSRPFGYIRLAGDVAHFELLHFSEEQVGDFIRHWQRAFEEWQHRDAPNYEAAAREAEEMFDELKGNPKVLELATNPLMLVIIALIRYEQTRLPQERVRLYDTAVKTLMETWNFWRSKVAGVAPHTQLKIDDLIIVWSAVAEWTRGAKPTGVVHRGELKTKLVEILQVEELGGPKPAETAEAYLDAAARRAGLLEERGPDIFAFWHPTFEEFLAAVKLTTPAHRAKERLLPLRRDPRWREVILLAVGHLGLIQWNREMATHLVEAIAFDDPDPLEPILHRHLLLAAEIVATDVGVKRTMSQRIVVKLAELLQKYPYDQFDRAFIETVRALSDLQLSEENVAAIARLTEYNDRLRVVGGHSRAWEVRMEAARLFSNVAADCVKARKLCEQLLSDAVQNVRCHAAVGLARAQDFRTDVWRELAGCWGTSVYIKPAGQQFLKTLPTSVSDTLFDLLGSDELKLRYAGARFLYEMERADDRVVETLLDLLNADDGDLRFNTASLLKERGRRDAHIFEVLLAVFNSKDEKLLHHQSSAALLLYQMGCRDEHVIEYVNDWIAPMFTTGSADFFKSFTQRFNDDDYIEWLYRDLSNDNDPLSFKLRARSLLFTKDGGDRLLEHFARAANTQPCNALAACQKLLHGHLLDADDGQALAELVRRHDGDTEEQRFAREWMFEWLWRKHQPKVIQ